MKSSLLKLARAETWKKGGSHALGETVSGRGERILDVFENSREWSDGEGE